MRPLIPLITNVLCTPLARSPSAPTTPCYNCSGHVCRVFASRLAASCSARCSTSVCWRRRAAVSSPCSRRATGRSWPWAPWPASAGPAAPPGTGPGGDPASWPPRGFAAIGRVRRGNHQFALFDAGLIPKALWEAGTPRWVVRLQTRCSLRRSASALYRGRGRRPQLEAAVRAFPRTYGEHPHPTTPPDRAEHWTSDGWTLRAEFWDGVVPREDLPQATPFTVVTVHDLRYGRPLLLGVQELSPRGEEAHAASRDRWPVGVVPLAAKQLLGTGRQFVSARESVSPPS